MILCLCKAVTDREVDDAIRRGANTTDAVGQMCGAGTDCGSCVDAIDDRIACQSACAERQHSRVERPAAATAATL